MRELDQLSEAIGRASRGIGIPSPARLSVLVVDDDEDDFVMLRAGLAHLNYRLAHVETVEAGIEELAKERHDAYLVDQKLRGGSDGAEFIEQANWMGFPGPFIVWSGHEFEPRRFPSVIHGPASGFIWKGTPPRMTDAAIREIVRQFRLHGPEQMVATHGDRTEIYRKKL